MSFSRRGEQREAEVAAAGGGTPRRLEKLALEGLYFSPTISLSAFSAFGLFFAETGSLR